MKRRELIRNILFSSSCLLFSNYSTLKLFGKSEDDIDIFKTIIRKALVEHWSDLSIGDLVIKIAVNFVGTPYISNTLEGDGDEICRVNLLGLDCVTFFETSLAFARIVKKKKYNFQDLISEITFTRYRNGVLSDYTSRLHYTADWILNNEGKGVINDVCKLVDGEKLKFDVFFMSKFPEKYKQLKNNPHFVDVIAERENIINNKVFYYFPVNEIPKFEKYIANGDIIAITTNIPGLDYSHTGLAYRNDKNEVRFLHASSVKKEVLLDISLYEYIKTKKKDTGISVLRPLEP